MQKQDRNAQERSERVQILCRELVSLVGLPREQRRRRSTDLLSALDDVMHHERLRRVARGSARSVGSSRG